MTLRVFCRSVAGSNPASTICGICVLCFHHSVRKWGTSVEILVLLLCPTERLQSSLLCVASCVPLLTTSGQSYTFTACWKSALQKRISDLLPAVLITCWGILFLDEWTVAIIDVETLQQVSTAAILETPIYQKLLENVGFLEVQSDRSCQSLESRSYEKRLKVLGMLMLEKESRVIC